MHFSVMLYNLNFCQKVRLTWSWLSRSCRRLFAQLILQHIMLVEFIYCTGHVPNWPGGFEFIPLGGLTLVKFPAHLSLLGMDHVVPRCRSHWLDQRGHRDQLYGTRDHGISHVKCFQVQGWHLSVLVVALLACLQTSSFKSFARPFLPGSHWNIRFRSRDWNVWRQCDPNLLDCKWLMIQFALRVSLLVDIVLGWPILLQVSLQHWPQRKCMCGASAFYCFALQACWLITWHIRAKV